LVLANLFNIPIDRPFLGPKTECSAQSAAPSSGPSGTQAARLFQSSTRYLHDILKGTRVSFLRRKYKTDLGISHKTQKVKAFHT
jgi:hypothetical protein